MMDVSTVNAYFSNLISSQMETLRQPLYKMQKDRTALNTTRSVYAQVSSQLSGLKDALHSLISTQANFSLISGRNIAVSNVVAGFNVLSATASSTALPGTYQILVNSLGQEQRVASRQVTSIDQALGSAGTILVGASTSITAGTNAIGDTVTGFDMGSIYTGQSELGQGTYTVRTQLNSEGRFQFRLFDASGNAVSIQSSTPGSFTTDWQDIPAATEYDTGVGLKISFAASGSYQVGETSVTYNPQTTLDITTADTLVSIANKINNATYLEGQGITASIVDRQLILSGTMTGTGHNIQIADLSGSVLSDLEIFDGTSFTHEIQAASSQTEFTVNGMTVIRDQNTGISDVIAGVTLNFAPDAIGKSATVTVSPTWNNARSSIDAFVSKFNSVQSYLTDQTAITKNDNNGTISYTRAALADDSSISELRTNLYDSFYTQATGGAYRLLSEIGISIDDSLQVKVTDADKLEKALNENSSGVKNLMDQVMGRMDTVIGNFTGTDSTNTGYISNMLTSIDSEIKDLGTDITDLTASLADRQNALGEQYAAMQAMLLQMSYDQQAWSTIYSTYSSSG